MNLREQSLPDLLRLAERIATEIERRRLVNKKTLLRQFHSMAQSVGTTLDDVLGCTGEDDVLAIASKSAARANRPSPPKGSPKRTSKKVKISPKYANPDDPKMTWSGRGRKPIWVEHKLNAGVPLEELRIPTSEESRSP